jgi:alkylation response protein AidB-like acyl-CoA dehydrogenase
VEDAFRLHGDNGYSGEYEIERLYRDATAADRRGTSEAQRMVIGKTLLEGNKKALR